MNESKPAAIQDLKEFGNLLAVREYVADLTKYCFSLYDSFKKTCADDEARNEPIKYELRNYNFKSGYSNQCTVVTYTEGYHNNADYKDYTTFASAVTNNLLQGLAELRITMNLSYRAGTSNSLTDHNHEYIIKFRPEGCSFEYKANYDDPAMNDIRDKLVEKLNQFPTTTTIFTKANNG